MKALVTGGGGFLGSAITKQLLARGDEVTILARGSYPAIESLGATGVQADLVSDPLEHAVAGMDVVFHVAALPGMWGPYERYHAINVTGTERILAAAKQAGVTRFVFTSSPSVTFHGTDELGVDEETATYPETFPFHYPATKALAEQHVLAANGSEIATTSLRPHLIYGPGDNQLLPRLIARHEAGRLRVIGDGTNKVALTYVDNAAVAHLQAADALAPGSDNAGKAYFITDGEPVIVWQWLREVFAELGMKPLDKQISASAALRVAGVLEWIWRTFGIGSDPPITRFTVEQVSKSHWYDLGAAKRDFGYAPVVDPDEGVRRMVEALRAERG